MMVRTEGFNYGNRRGLFVTPATIANMATYKATASAPDGPVRPFADATGAQPDEGWRS